MSGIIIAVITFITIIIIILIIKLLIPVLKKGGGRMSSRCSQKLQKGWGTHVLRVLSKIARKTVGDACPQGAPQKSQKKNGGSSNRIVEY
jgi:hypothetical protein